MTHDIAVRCCAYPYYLHVSGTPREMKHSQIVAPPLMLRYSEDQPGEPLILHEAYRSPTSLQDRTVGVSVRIDAYHL